ncbi:MAG TPA: DUF2231 domain-containing protein [Micromonosporaceae bacterium]
MFNLFDTFLGLPLHPLVVHATVVFVPLAALLVGVAAVWPAARRRLAWWPPIVTLVALVSAQVAQESGERLEARVPDTPLVRAHAHLADGLSVFVFGLLVISLVVTYLTRRSAPTQAERSRLARLVLPVAAVLGVALAAGTLVQVVRIGHSGAKAAWQQAATTTPQPRRHERD